MRTKACISLQIEVKLPNTVPLGGEQNGSVLGGGGGRYSGASIVFYYKNGGKNGGTVFGEGVHGIWGFHSNDILYK